MKQSVNYTVVPCSVIFSLHTALSFPICGHSRKGNWTEKKQFQHTFQQKRNCPNNLAKLAARVRCIRHGRHGRHRLPIQPAKEQSSLTIPIVFLSPTRTEGPNITYIHKHKFVSFSHTHTRPKILCFLP
jgi:hypothetical protein